MSEQGAPLRPVASTSDGPAAERAAWIRIEALLAAALDLPRDGRASFLDTACAADPWLRAEVGALLAAVDRDGPVDVPVEGASGLLSTLERFDPTADLAPGCQLGPYVIVSPVGAGGMGQVYRARDPRLDRDVAIKIVAPHLQRDPASRQRLEREARVVASLSHPNIVAIHDIGDHDGMLYIVTELLSGRTLREMFRSGPLDERAIVDIGIQVARGLSAAHGSRVVHRDLKPENLFMTRQGVIKILDFGLAEPYHRASDDTGPVAAAHAVAGTIGYMSPEQISGGALDNRSDIFSLGAVLYEAAAHAPAFAGDAPPDCGRHPLSTARPDLPRISPALARTIMRCLAGSPDDRHQNAADLAFTLQLLEGEPSRTAGAATTPPAAAVTRRRWPVRAAAVAALAVVLGIEAVRIAGEMNAQRGGLPLTFVTHAPEGTRFSGVTMAPEPAVSADGRRMAFIAFSGSQRGLWVQTIGELEAVPVVRGVSGNFPFWSPDGDVVAFGSAERLQKIAASRDQAVQQVCACDAAWGGSWGRNDTIVFAGAAGVFRVTSDGGDAVPVTRLDPSLGELSHRYPVLLPDGRRFLYVVVSTQDAHRGVYLGSLDDPSFKRRLLPDDSNVAYGPGPDGREYLFFVRDHVLLAQPFDTSRATLESDPIVVAQPVVPGEGGRLAPFAVGGRSLVYRVRDNLQTALLWINRRGGREGRITLPDGYYRYPVMSPDGTRLAVMMHDPGTRRADIWVVDLLRGVTERLTSDRVGAFFPQWMPDGRRVVFASARSGRWEVYSQDIAERADAPLFGSPWPGSTYPTGVAGDRRFLLTEGGKNVLALPLTPGDEPLVLAAGRHGRLSPDGRWLAYVAYDAGNPEVYVSAFPTPTPSARWRVSTTGGRYPHWAQDGRELYFVAGDNTLTAVPVATGTTFELGTPQPLFRVWPDLDAGGFGSVYAPAPDGQRFIVTEPRGAAESTPGAEALVLTVTTNWNPAPGRR